LKYKQTSANSFGFGSTFLIYILIKLKDLDDSLL